MGIPGLTTKDMSDLFQVVVVIHIGIPPLAAHQSITQALLNITILLAPPRTNIIVAHPADIEKDTAAVALKIDILVTRKGIDTPHLQANIAKDTLLQSIGPLKAVRRNQSLEPLLT